MYVCIHINTYVYNILWCVRVCACARVTQRVRKVSTKQTWEGDPTKDVGSGLGFRMRPRMSEALRQLSLLNVYI
jgi:hypothetical protein